jgi:hypothetical protein
MAHPPRPALDPVFYVNGESYVILRPAVETLGLDFETHLADLRARGWATCVEVPMVGLDGEVGSVVVVDRRTWLTFLFCLDPGMVAERARPPLIAYQSESANNFEGHLEVLAIEFLKELER